MHNSWHAGRPVTTATAETIADGIAVRVPVPAAVRDLQTVVDEMVLVDDAALVSAMRMTGEHLGVLGEPSGVAGIAAASQLSDRLRGRQVATVLCGSNVAPEHAWQVSDG